MRPYCLHTYIMKLTKKQQIERKAKELFWKHGFKKVTIEEICKKAIVSRKTFYTFYENKSALVIFLLEQIIEEMMTEYKRIINSELPFSEKIEQMLTLKYESSKSFSMEFVDDFFHPDAEDILAIYTKITQELMSMIHSFFIDAQKNNEINPDLDIKFVMLMMQKMLDITSQPDVMKLFPDTETMTRQISQFVIYGIMPTKKI